MECAWTEDSDGTWHTSCNAAFTLNDGTPSQNRMAFCCYCGQALLEVPYVLENLTDDGKGPS